MFQMLIPENTTEQGSLAFTIDNDQACSCSRDTPPSSQMSTDILQSTNEYSEETPVEKTTQTLSSNNTEADLDKCDCVKCNSGNHHCVLKFIRVGAEQTFHELYVDGSMIQEHTENPYNYNLWKSKDDKKND